MLPKNDSKIEIIEKLREYNNKTSRVRLDFFRSKFFLLNDLIKILINDPYVTNDDRKFLNQILHESHILENKVKSNYIIE